MNTRHYLPTAPAVRQVIQAIWQVEGYPSFLQENIIPKGVVEVIFNFSDGPAIPAQLGHQQYHLSDCFINGFNTLPVRVQLPRHQVYFGVVFQPLAVKKIFRTPAGVFSDQTVDLTLLDPSVHSLWHRLAEQADFDSRVAIFRHWLEPYLTDWPPQEQYINRFLYAAGQHDRSVKELAGALCYSPRHLARKLQEATGMNTEEVLLYKKYLHAVDLMHQPGLSLTEIAHQSHFADQSHFIRTFKAYAQTTPGAYRRNRGLVKGHLYENVR